MAEVTTTFTIDTETMRMVDIDPGQPRFGPANVFLEADTDNVDGRPEWFESLEPGATPIQLLSGDTLDATENNFRVSHEQNGSNPRVQFSLAAKPYFPLTEEKIKQLLGSTSITIGPFSFSASDVVDVFLSLSVFDIDADIFVTFDKRADGELIAMVSGTHDKFPYYEVYINDDSLRYDFTPKADDAPERLRASFEPEKIERPSFVVPRLPGER